MVRIIPKLGAVERPILQGCEIFFSKMRKTVMSGEKLRGLAKGAANALPRAPRRSATLKARLRFKGLPSAEEVWGILPPAITAWKSDMSQVEMREAKATR